MNESLADSIIRGHWGDFASVAGFILTLIGFAFTIAFS
jgi:hypothetical protein